MPVALIVDDDFESLYYLKKLLEGNAFTVMEARNGREALEIAEKECPDIVISDILMPVMDGYSLLKQWKTSPEFENIPFIFYTATFTEARDEELALRLGADLFLIKPLDPEKLLSSIKKILEDSRNGITRKPLFTETSEEEFLRDYSERIFWKLEQKMAALEKTNRELKNTMEARKHLEEELRQVQKMEAIGRFAGVLAHDFNNLLTVISSSASLLLDSFPPGHPDRINVENILEASKKAANLTRDLLLFSRKPVLKLERHDLNSVVDGTRKFFSRVLDSKISVSFLLSQEPLPVMLDKTHFEQVLLNLVTNAGDAMPSGGELYIETGKEIFSESSINSRSPISSGKFACVTVRDTGHGMDKETCEKIFEPFFTTKEPGKGTGLGLSIAYSIVKQHNGYITVESQVGKGAEFKVYLPLAD